MKPVLLIYLTALLFYSCKRTEESAILTTAYFGGGVLTIEGSTTEYAEACDKGYRGAGNHQRK